MAADEVIPMEIPWGEFQEAKESFEKQYVEALLTETEGNMTDAAELAGKERKDFYTLVRRTEVDPEEFRP